MRFFAFLVVFVRCGSMWSRRSGSTGGDVSHGQEPGLNPSGGAKARVRQGQGSERSAAIFNLGRELQKENKIDWKTHL